MNQGSLLAAFAAAAVLCASADAANAEKHAIDIQQRHANGAHITLSSMEVTDTEIRIDLRVVNGHSEPIILNSGVKRSFVLAGSDARLYLVPPDGNRELRIPARSTVEGNLVFMGAFAEGADLKLVLNELGGDNSAAPMPKFEFALPDTGGAAEAGGESKKN